MSSLFLQLHTLTSYPAVLLNRDDAGFAKRIPFGGVTRTRISSQCLKRHWRTFDGPNSLSGIDGVEMSVRSRLSFEKFVLEPIVEEGVDKEKAIAVVRALMTQVLGESKKSKAAKTADTQAADVHTSQLTVLGHPELRFLLDEARKICSAFENPRDAEEVVKEHFSREAKKNLKGLKMASGLGGALFGRMVTSDILARGDAAVHVAHAFTVHEEASESDYFSAVDDLLAQEGQLGSGHLNSVELNSGLYYGYVAVDVPLLVSNLEGCPRTSWKDADLDLAAEVVRRLIWTVATVSPGAKLGSTAPHAYAQMMLAEAGPAQPRTLANAFLNPVRQLSDLLAATYKSFGAHLADMDSVFGAGTDRAFAALGPYEELKLGARISMEELASWAAEQIRGA